MSTDHPQHFPASLISGHTTFYLPPKLWQTSVQGRFEPMLKVIFLLSLQMVTFGCLLGRVGSPTWVRPPLLLTVSSPQGGGQSLGPEPGVSSGGVREGQGPHSIGYRVVGGL